MKKRFKLILSISSLCLALAILAFGVYAASTVTYNGTISIGSYSFDHALVKVERTVYKLKTQPSAAVSQSDALITGAFASGSWTSVGTSSFQTYSGTTWANPSANTTTGIGVDTSSGVVVTDSFTNAAISFSTSYLWRIEITVSTVNSTGVTPTVTAPKINTSSNCYVVVGSATAGTTLKSSTKITSSTPVKYVFFVGITDATGAVSAGSVTYSMSFAKA